MQSLVETVSCFLGISQKQNDDYMVKIENYSDRWVLSWATVHRAIEVYHLDKFRGPTGDRFETEFLIPIRESFCKLYKTTTGKNPTEWDKHFQGVIDNRVPFN